MNFMKPQEARKLGLKTYLGTPCRKYGHTKRYANTGRCFDCDEIYKRDNKDLIAESHRRYIANFKLTHDLPTVKRRAYELQRNQVIYRNEIWDMDLAEWNLLWYDKWTERGTKSDQYSMTRIDVTKSWSVQNVKILLRSDQLRINNNRVNIYEFKTPLGVYKNLKEAQKANDLSAHHMNKMRMQYPDQYYFTRKNK